MTVGQTGSGFVRYMQEFFQRALTSDGRGPEDRSITTSWHGQRNRDEGVGMPARGVTGFGGTDRVRQLFRWFPQPASDVLELALAEALRRDGAGSADGELIVRSQLRDRELVVDIRIGGDGPGAAAARAAEPGRVLSVCAGAPAWSGQQRSA